MTNHKKLNKWKFEANTCSWSQVWENMCDCPLTSRDWFSFVLDWLIQYTVANLLNNINKTDLLMVLFSNFGCKLCIKNCDVLQEPSMGRSIFYSHPPKGWQESDPYNFCWRPLKKKIWRVVFSAAPLKKTSEGLIFRQHLWKKDPKG